jgi:D-alanyl-D-alanine endopeptidase (penicillin-binding protein 7)
MQAMNAKARQLGMNNTHFDDPSGLSSKNTSTALDIMIMIKAALDNPTIRNLSTVQRTEIIVNEKKKSARVVVQNTNVTLLEEFNTIVLSKTGLTTPAGWCLALALDENNKNYALIVLGANTKEHRKKLIEQTIYANLR